MSNIKTPESRQRATFDFSRLKARWASEDERMRIESEQLMADVERLGRPVFTAFGADRAVIFGSSIKGRAHPRSDIDLLVTGTDRSAYWDLRAALEEAFDRPVDLFTEADNPKFVTKILERGRVIYEA